MRSVFAATLETAIAGSVLASVLVAVPSGPAAASPLSAKWGLSVTPLTTAVEAELQFQGLPLGLSSRLGAAGLPFVRSDELGIEAAGNWWTTWGHYTHALSPQVSVGALAGVSQSWFFRGAPIPFRNWYSSVQPLVPFTGAFFQYDWGRTWLRVSPSVTLLTSGPSGAPTLDYWEAAVLGPALCEVGVRTDDVSEWRFRTSLTPITYTRSF